MTDSPPSAAAYHRRLRTGLASLCCVVALGCSTGPAKHVVSGIVSLDGKPLSAGDIVFMAADNSSSEGSKIDHGRYRLRAAAGKYKVLINAAVRAQLSNPGPEPREVWYHKSIIPIRYNDETTLTATVGQGNDNRCDFALVGDAQ